MNRKIYRGLIILGSNGEEDEILYLAENGKLSAPFADIIKQDLHSFGKYLSVHFYTSDKEIPKDKIEETFIMSLYGLGDASYGMRYSDYTGYLYTEESLKVDGHDLLEQLKYNKGRYCHLVIEYNKKPLKFNGKVEKDII